jgi:hypothetical protein
MCCRKATWRRGRACTRLSEESTPGSGTSGNDPVRWPMAAGHRRIRRRRMSDNFRPSPSPRQGLRAQDSTSARARRVRGCVPRGVPPVPAPGHPAPSRARRRPERRWRTTLSLRRRFWHGHCFPGGWNPHEEDTVANRAPILPLLATLVTLQAAPASAQANLSFSVGVGSLFSGVSFGLYAGDYHPGSAFVGLSFGLGWGGHYGASPYGIYSATYDGWDYGHRGHPVAAVSSCWDSYWDTYWDPWNDWYWDCVVSGPYAYGSFRASSWWWRNSWWRSPATFVYWGDPFATPWGPYWAYDPWGWYWDGWGWGGWGWGSRTWAVWSTAPAARVRAVYAAGGRRGVNLGRVSPLAGVGYKESPRGVASNTARRRPSGAAPGSLGSPGRPDAVAPRPGAAAGRAPSDRGALGAPAPRRPSDRISPERGGRASAPTARPAAPSRAPSARPSTGGRAGGAIERPSAPAIRGGSLESPRRSAPSVSVPRSSAPSARAPSRPDVSRAAPAPSRPQASRTAPSAARPQASRPAPSTSRPQASRPAPSTSRQAPRAAPSVSRPRASAAPSRSSGSGSRSAPPPRRRGGGDA